MVRRVLFFSLLLVLVYNVQSAKILAVFPMPSFSHFSLGFRLAKELADRGHQVTAINPYPQKTPIKNYRDISVAENIEFVEVVKRNLLNIAGISHYGIMQLMYNMGNGLTEFTYKNKNVQELLKSNETFDLVIIEHFVNDAHVGFAHHFNAPVILIGCMGPGALNNYIFANPAPSSYVPNQFGTFTKHMTFWQRTQNFFYNTMTEVLREIFFLSKQREIFKKYITSDVELDQVLHNVSILFTTSHVSVNDAVPHVPSVIEIGGYHINPPKDLPTDLKKFLDESKEGVVLFSMGSNLKSKNLKPEIREGILRAFSKIKQNVLWKFEAELDDLPKNVKIMKWIPQQDVLAHPNVKVFISHGGLLSTIETVYFGVPIIGIPVFADQKMNIASAVNNGYAVSVPLAELSEEKLSWALNEVLNKPKYRENVKQRSRVMNDQPLKPIDNAIYWVEHVIRHKGAPHLRPAGIDLKWYQRHLIDVIVFLTLVTIFLFVILYIIIRKILGLCVTKKFVVRETKKNK